MNVGGHPLPGRPREFDPEEVLETVARIFWRQGYAGTSMSELIAATGVQKASLYAAFGDKSEIYSKALAGYCETLLDGIRLSMSIGRPQDRFAHLLRGVVARVSAHDRTGCFLCAATSDLASPPQSRNIVRVALGRLERVFAQALDDFCPAPRDRTTMAKGMLSAYVGIQTLARGGYPAEALEVIALDSAARVRSEMRVSR